MGHLGLHRTDHVLPTSDERDGGIDICRGRHGGGGQSTHGLGRGVDLIDVIALNGLGGSSPAEGCHATSVGHGEVGGRCHHVHAKGRITHQCQMCLPDASLPTFRLWGVQPGVVHGGQCARTDGFAHAHVVEVPRRDRRPAIGQSLTTGQWRAQEIVLVVPIAEVASEGHVEDPAHAHRSGVVLGGGHVVGTVVGQHAPLHPLRAAPGGIGPHVALPVDVGIEGTAIGIGIRDVGRADQGRQVAPAAAGERVADPLQVVEHDTTHLGRPDLALELADLVQVRAHQVHLALGKGGHVVHIHPCHL